jgi:hypothetical protein
MAAAMAAASAIIDLFCLRCDIMYS